MQYQQYIPSMVPYKMHILGMMTSDNVLFQKLRSALINFEERTNVLGALLCKLRTSQH